MSIPDDYIGEPGYPAPWTTSTPREGLRDTDQALIISLAPDVCRSPGTPIPYPVVDFCGHDENYTPSVRFTGQKAMVMRSNTSHVHGDEPGIGKGIVSDTVGGISEPIEHAAQVRAEGSPVIRHLDRFHMNNRNTVGEAIFVRDAASYPVPKDDDPLPGSMVAQEAPFESYQVAQAATGTMTDAGGGLFSGGSKAGRAAPPVTQVKPQTGLGRRGGFGKSLSIELVDAITGGRATQRRIEGVLSELDYYAGTPGKGLSAPQMEILGKAAAQIRSTALPAGDYDLADGIRKQAWEDIKDQARAAAGAAAGTGVRVSVAASEKHEVECFEVSDKYDRDEYRDQLKKQEEELNEMSPEEYLERRRAYKDGETTRGGTAQREARKEWLEKRRDELLGTGEYSRREAEQLANDEAKGLAALHALDLVAGGLDRIWRMGHRGVNSSIGSKWIKKGRLDKMDEYAERIKGKQEKMDVALEDC